MFAHINLLLALAASSLVSASPIASKATPRATDSENSADAKSTSKGFQLVADVTNPFNALADSVQNTVLQAYHAGASNRVPILRKPDAENPGRVFYFDRPPQNSSSILVTDSFSADTPSESASNPSIPFGLSVQSPTDYIVPEYPQEHGVWFSSGTGDATAVALADMRTPYGGLYVLNQQGSGTFMACNRTIPYYNLESDLTLEYLYDSDASSPGGKPTVPDNCVPIRLVLVCADLPDLPAGSQPTHDNAQIVSCYTDMSGSVSP